MNEKATPTEPETLSQTPKPASAGLKMIWWLVAVVLGAVGGYVGWSAGHDLVGAFLGAMLGLLFGFLVANVTKRGCGT